MKDRETDINETVIQNPVLPGFYPDPSIIRVEDDFYMVTFSFSYFPGIPIFHSRDLAHWEQIGHVLDRPEQLPLNAELMSHGIWAPTIRCHEGIYYVIATNVDHGFHFIVTAEDPAGDWSDPHWIEGIHGYGIDPSLFWDDDGTAYYMCTGGVGSEQQIWLAEIDLDTCQPGKRREPVWGGALRGANGVEAPHIYKRNGWYYLMVAEGGTEQFHSVTIARSRDIWGPYDGYEGNPILTHRNLGTQYPISNVGHGDLVELKDGTWYMAVLASRPYGGYHKNMGRETFLVPVSWEYDWPIAAPESGKVEWVYPAPKLPDFHTKPEPARDDFDSTILRDCWNFLGTPDPCTCRLENSMVKLRLARFCFEKQRFDGFFENLEPVVQSASFLGRRQQHMNFTVSAKMEFWPEETQTAGIMLLQNDFHSLRIEAAATEDGTVIRVIKGYASLEPSLKFKENRDGYWKVLCGQIPWEQKSAVLTAEVREQRCAFYVQDPSGSNLCVANDLDCSFLGSETASGFLGTYVGMFASGNGTDYDKYAAFDWFTYEEITENEKNLL